jgi:hypothetical protein
MKQDIVPPLSDLLLRPLIANYLILFAVKQKNYLDNRTLIFKEKRIIILKLKKRKINESGFLHVRF